MTHAAPHGVRRTAFSRTAAHHLLIASAVSMVTSTLALLLVAVGANPHAVAHALGHLRAAWLLAVLACGLLSLVGYAIAYRPVVRRFGRYRLTARGTARMVMAGFGAFAVLGGFSLDRRGLQRLGADPRSARLSVLALGLFELSILAPAAGVAAVALLAAHAQLNGTMLWPWALGVPLGTAALVVLVWRERQARHRPATRLADALDLARRIIREPSTSGQAWLGMSVCFAAETAALASALRTVGVAISPGRVVIAYASGYLLTRRSLPLGSAGFVEIFLTYALH